MSKNLLFTITEKELRYLLEVRYCMAKKKEIRPVITGMYFTTKDSNKIEVCALDGYRLSKRVLDNVKYNNQFNFILTRDSIMKLYKTTKSNKNIVNVYYVDQEIQFEFVNQNKQIECSTIKDNYIQYNHIIPQENDLEIKLDSKELINIIKNIRKEAKKNNLDILHIVFKIFQREDNYRFQIQVQCRQSKEIEYCKNLYLNDFKILKNELKESFEIAINIDYIYQAIKLYKGSATIGFNSSVTPITIQQNNKLDLVLPIRILETV